MYKTKFLDIKTVKQRNRHILRFTFGFSIKYKYDIVGLKISIIGIFLHYREFFERMAPEMHLQHEFRDWFAIPFIVNPESHPTFSAYFSRQVKTWSQAFLHLPC